MLLWSVNYQHLCTGQFAFDNGSAKRKVTIKSHVTTVRCAKSHVTTVRCAKSHVTVFHSCRIVLYLKDFSFVLEGFFLQLKDFSFVLEGYFFATEDMFLCKQH